MSDKITSEDCKRMIVDFVFRNKGFIAKQFVPPLTDAQLEPALKEKNWKRRYKQYSQFDDAIERSFDCAPFDDQLRGYVYERNGKIIKVFAEGE